MLFLSASVIKADVAVSSSALLKTVFRVWFSFPVGLRVELWNHSQEEGGDRRITARGAQRAAPRAVMHADHPLSRL